MAIDVLIPKIGESVATVFIARWLIKPGEVVTEGQSVLEIDSDKASMEVPAPTSGVLSEQLAAEGDEVPVGSAVARIEAGAVAAPEKAAASSAAKTSANPPATAKPDREPTPPAEPPAQLPQPASGSDPKAGPAARAAAAAGGVDLAVVPGTGPHGRITSGDVRAAKAVAPTLAAAASPGPAGDTTRVKMSPIRRTIARRLVEAKQTTAMLTTFNEVDMSRVMELRKAYQDAFVKRHGLKLGFMSFFVKASIDALKQYPAVNAEIDGTDIVYKHFFHIGVAVSGPKGLVVPVLRDADLMSLAEIEKGIGDLATKARDNTLRPEDFEGGTFTISNGGVFGSMLSTPILNSPQVGILGMHNIVDRPVAIQGAVVIRPIMYLALTYDHRIIDGREAVSFLVRIKEILENPERLLLEV